MSFLYKLEKSREDSWKFWLWLDGICITRNIDLEGEIRDFINIDGFRAYGLSACFEEGLTVENTVSLRAYSLGWAMPDVKFSREKIWYTKDNSEKYPNQITRIGFISQSIETLYIDVQIKELASECYNIWLDGETGK